MANTTIHPRRARRWPLPPLFVCPHWQPSIHINKWLVFFSSFFLLDICSANGHNHYADVLVHGHMICARGGDRQRKKRLAFLSFSTFTVPMATTTTVRPSVPTAPNTHQQVFFSFFFLFFSFPLHLQCQRSPLPCT